jgi:hypothetical protein
MKKVQLEMGGKNPLVVLDDADLKTAVDCAVNGAFFSTGQRCTASSRLIVTKGIHDKFVAAVVERLKGVKVDNALKQGTDIGPVVDKNQLNQDLFYIEEAKRMGLKVLPPDVNGVAHCVIKFGTGAPPFPSMRVPPWIMSAVEAGFWAIAESPDPIVASTAVIASDMPQTVGFIATPPFCSGCLFQPAAGYCKLRNQFESCK